MCLPSVGHMLMLITLVQSLEPLCKNEAIQLFILAVLKLAVMSVARFSLALAA